MEGKELKDLSDKEREKVREILSKGELVEESTMEDDAIIADKIRKGEIMSVTLIEKFKLLTERKLRKTEREVVFEFGRNISVERISDDKIEITIGKEKIIVTDKQAKKIISNGFADKKYVSVTGVCKKEVWEKQEQKGSIKGLIAAGVAIAIIAIPIIIKGCDTVSKNIPDPVPEHTIAETTTNTEPLPINYPTVPDPTIEPSEKVEPSNIFRFFENIKWIPGTTQQYEWSSIEDSDVLGIDNPKNADNINKEMQENTKLLSDINEFEKKYSGITVNSSNYDDFIKEAQGLIERVNIMLNNSYEAIELAEVLNQKVIEADVPHLGDLETESETRKIILEGIKAIQDDSNDLTNELNRGGKTI